MKKYILIVLILLIIIPSNLLADTTIQNNYEITDFITEATLDSSGNMKVSEIIKVEGTYTSFIRDLFYRDSELPIYSGTISDFKESDLYNASNIKIYKVGTIDYDKDLDFDAFLKEVNVSGYCIGTTNCYQESNIKDGLNLKIFNETENGVTYFYIEYLLGNIAVLHEDIVEVYYDFINSNFNNDIKKYKLRLILPNGTLENINLWSHSPNSKTSIIKDNTNGLNYGGYLELENIQSHTKVDMRILFPKNLIDENHYFLKKSNEYALNIIKLLEDGNIPEPEIIEKPSLSKYLINGTSIFYIIITVCIIIYVHIKYDRELKSRFKGPYYKEIIEDYDITHIEYLFRKNITGLSLSSSIINMIYKKNIKCKELDNEDLELKLIKTENLNNRELEIVNLLFNVIGDGKKVTLEIIKESASTLSSEIINTYYNWKQALINKYTKEKFFEENKDIKLFFSLYSLLGIMVILTHMSIRMFSISTFIVFIITIIYIIYIVSFTKKTRKGRELYARWKGFSKYLRHFKKLNKKNIPDLKMWEKYLVYSNVFGLTKSLSEDMNVLLSELNNVEYIEFNPNYYKSLSSKINNTISTSLKIAHSEEVKNDNRNFE